MSLRLVALDEGSDILVDRPVVVVGRHPTCDARLDSIRISRRHCCMTPGQGEVVVKDLGSTNGIRINGQRVEMGRLRPGDELSIAHIRFRLDSNNAQEPTLAEAGRSEDGHVVPFRIPLKAPSGQVQYVDDKAFVAAVRDILPKGLPERCKIQVVVTMEPEASGEANPEEKAEPCRGDSCP